MRRPDPPTTPPHQQALIGRVPVIMGHQGGQGVLGQQHAHLRGGASGGGVTLANRGMMRGVDISRQRVASASGGVTEALRGCIYASNGAGACRFKNN